MKAWVRSLRKNRRHLSIRCRGRKTIPTMLHGLKIGFYKCDPVLLNYCGYVFLMVLQDVPYTI